jgi:SAM-dependent MidA family methyltransferase
MPDVRATTDFALARRATPLAAVIRAELASRGPMPFARFMELALGHPEHGYYSRPDLAWGARGDYETSPEVHPIFGYLWARQLLECWERLGRPRPFHIVEPGAGSGAFAASLLTWLRERAPDCYAVTEPALLDGHPRRLDQQRATLEAHGHRASHALLADWLAERSPLTGVLISNELFDTLPVHLVERRGGALREWHVVAAPGGELTLELREPSTPALAARFDALELQPGDDCRAEVSFAAPGLMSALAARVERGYLITVDYGYEAATLYAPWRRMGTLMAFRDHSPQPDPLALPGLTDLTAHVDFTTLAAAAGARGFESAPTVSQAEALIGLGIAEQLESARHAAAADLGGYAAARATAEKLLDPVGLGRIRVLVQARGAPLDGLACLRAMPTPRAPSP